MQSNINNFRILRTETKIDLSYDRQGRGHIKYLIFFFPLHSKQVVGDREKFTPKSGKISPKMCHFGQNIDFIAKLTILKKKSKKLRLSKDESNRFPPFQVEILKCNLRIETKLNDMSGSVFCRYLGQFRLFF